jgi:hypothetical protein
LPAVPTFGGSSQQHAAVAEEFRRMAAEIGAFLKKKPVKPAKKPSKKPSKKTATKKTATKKPKAKKPSSSRRVLGGFFNGY